MLTWKEVPYNIMTDVVLLTLPVLMIWNEANNEMFDWRGLFKKKIDFQDSRWNPLSLFFTRKYFLKISGRTLYSIQRRFRSLPCSVERHHTDFFIRHNITRVDVSDKFEIWSLSINGWKIQYFFLCWRIYAVYFWGAPKIWSTFFCYVTKKNSHASPIIVESQYTSTIRSSYLSNSHTEPNIIYTVYIHIYSKQPTKLQDIT